MRGLPLTLLLSSMRPSVSLFCLFFLVCLSVLSVFRSVCLSVCLPVCLSVCLSIFLSVCLSFCLCLSVCLFFFSSVPLLPVFCCWVLCVRMSASCLPCLPACLPAGVPLPLTAVPVPWLCLCAPHGGYLRIVHSCIVLCMMDAFFTPHTIMPLPASGQVRGARHDSHGQG
jgi:hypothetical protein